MPFLSMAPNEWGCTEMEWKPLENPPPPKKRTSRIVLPPVDPIREALEEWYQALGQPVPPEDLAALDLPLDPFPVLESPAESDSDASGPVGARPEYGTKEFWKWYSANKAYFDAKKKEKEDKALQKAQAKAQKEAEKKKLALEKLQAKEAKAQAKQEKELAKLTKKMAKTRVG